MMAGQGLGDVRILFNQVAVDGCVTYNGVSQLYSILVKRRRRLQERIEAEKQEAERKEREREEVERERRWLNDEPEPGDVSSSSRSLNFTASSEIKGSFRPGGKLPSDSHHPPHHPASKPAAAKSTAATSGSARFAELMSPPAAVPATPPVPVAAAPVASSSAIKAAWGSRPATALAGGLASNPGVPASNLNGMESLLVKRDPPILLRESFPPPECEFSHIKTKIKGVRVRATGCSEPGEREALSPSRHLRQGCPRFS